MEHERPKPKGFVRLKITERAARIAMWLNQNFLLQDGEVVADDSGNLPQISFLCLRNRPNVRKNRSMSTTFDFGQMMALRKRPLESLNQRNFLSDFDFLLTFRPSEPENAKKIILSIDIITWFES